MSLFKRVLGAAALIALVAVPVSAATITYVDLGTAAPPATLGGYTMTPFADDVRPDFSAILTVPSPLGGSLVFGSAMDKRTVGSSWATWSHGYTGDIYYTGGATQAKWDLPASTAAFYFYAEPNPFAVHLFTVTASDGTVSTLAIAPIDGLSGARGFGFYSDGSITSIAVSSTADFAVGEFGIATPEPASLLLLGTGLAAVAARRRRAKK